MTTKVHVRLLLLRSARHATKVEDWLSAQLHGGSIAIQILCTDLEGYPHGRLRGAADGSPPPAHVGIVNDAEL